MVPKRIAQAWDSDGKPTVRNLAEALEALSQLGCDLEAGRIWFEVIPTTSSPAVSASLFYSTEHDSVDVRLVLPLLRAVRGRTKLGAPLHLSLEAFHLAKVDGRRAASSSATLTDGTSVHAVKFDLVQFPSRWTTLEEAIIWLTIKAFKAEHIFLRRHFLTRPDENSPAEYRMIGIDYSILHIMREPNVKNLTGYINDHIGQLPRGEGQPKFGPVSEAKVQQTLNIAGIRKVRGPRLRRAA